MFAPANISTAEKKEDRMEEMGLGTVSVFKTPFIYFGKKPAHDEFQILQNEVL